MRTKLTCLWSGLVGTVFSSLVLLGISPVPVDSAPRLLWQTKPQGG